MKSGKTWLGVLATTGLLATAVAQAGYVYQPGVEFYDQSNWFDEMYGSMLGARNSANSIEYLKCRTFSSSSAYCYGRTSDGTYKSCSTTEAALVRAVESLNPYSYLRFGFISGTCYYIEVQHSSQYLP